MKARCTSCGRETWFRQPRGWRLEFQRCQCGGSYTRISEAVDRRPCQGDAYEPVSPRHRAPDCGSCAKSERRGGKCAPRLRTLTAEQWQAEVEEMEARLRRHGGRLTYEPACDPDGAYVVAAASGCTHREAADAHRIEFEYLEEG